MEIDWRKRIEVWLVTGAISLGLSVLIDRYLPFSETTTSWGGMLLGVTLAACLISFTLLPGVVRDRNQDQAVESLMKKHWYNNLEVWFVTGLLSLGLSALFDRYLVAGEATKLIAGVLLGLSLAANIVAIIMLPNAIKDRTK